MSGILTKFPEQIKEILVQLPDFMFWKAAGLLNYLDDKVV